MNKAIKTILIVISIDSFLFGLAYIGILYYNYKTEAKPLFIPEKKDVYKIEVSENCYSYDESSFFINDKHKIENVISFLTKHNDSFYYPLGDTAPGLPYRIVLFKKNGNELGELVIWLGNNTLMGREIIKHDRGTRLKYISPLETKELINHLGITSQCE